MTPTQLTTVCQYLLGRDAGPADELDTIPTDHGYMITQRQELIAQVQLLDSGLHVTRRRSPFIPPVLLPYPQEAQEATEPEAPKSRKGKVTHQATEQ